MKILAAFVLAVVLGIGLTTSCESDNTYEVETSAECLVTSATLGSLSRTLHTLSSTGEDSTYTVTVAGAYYPLYIDQLENRIYNGDSLPVGTDVSRVTFQAFSTVGTCAIRSLNSGVDTVFSASDSTDFRQERLLTVYSSDRTATREYRIRINVHQEEGDTFRWAQPVTGNAYLAALDELRAASRDGQLYVFGMEGGQSVSLTAATAEPGQWTRRPMGGMVPEMASIVSMGGRFYGLSGSSLVTSDDGAEWVPTGSQLQVEALVAAGSTSLYALSDGQLYASSDGVAWMPETLDEPDRFPASGYVSAVIPSRTDPTFEDILLVGEGGGEANVWKRNVDLTGREQFAWNYYPRLADNPYNCPLLTGHSLFAYDEGAVLGGLDAAGELAPLYMTHDGGRTWLDDEIPLPAVTRPKAVALTADADNYIWILCAGTGDVWRGRFNRLGWKLPETSFTRNTAIMQFR